MKNYYELLEVSQNASSEVIEKAYKTLVKKYHPDLQPDNNKKNAEQKIKDINEAYEILSDKNKKAEYDRKLAITKYQEEKQHINDVNRTNYQNNNTSKRVVKPPNPNNTQNSSNNINFQNEYQKKMNEEFERAYQDAYNKAYIQNLKDMGYTIKYEKTFKEQVKYIFSIISFIFITIFICFLLWHVPFIRSYLIDLYNTNDAIKLIVDFFINIFSNLIDMFR